MNVGKLIGLMTSASSVGAIGKNTGVSNDQVSQVLTQVLPLLLNGASKQATNKNTAASFAQALAQHSKSNTSDIASFLGGVDTADGAKIIQHLLGGDAKTTTASIAKAAGVTQNQANDIMSNVAPLLMGVLGQQSTKHQASAVTGVASANTDIMSALMSGMNQNDLTNILSSLAGAQAPAKKKSGIDAGDVVNILGKILK